jgi:FHA domain
MKWKIPGSGDDKGKRPSGPTERKPSSGEGKTTYVGRASSDEQTTGKPSGGIRSGPAQRLSWPARDQQQPKKVTYYSPGGGGDESSDRTQLHDPTKANAEPRAATQGDPVVGWLVVIEGPGKGRSLEIGIGSNSIGRDARQKIALNFGDEAIHRQKHAMIVFDPKSGHFFLQAGNDSRNLTYIGEKLVLAPIQLHGGEVIVIGQTKLVFVAFCGPDFSWS